LLHHTLMISKFFLHRTSIVFFFYPSAYHRNLPSFPTRRSSDLPLPPTAAPRARFGRTGCGHNGRVGRRAPDPIARRRRSERTARDRKSTRLNSSHEWISYAVFCLKKKKTRTT